MTSSIMHQPPGVEPGMRDADGRDDFARQRNRGDVVDAEQLGTQPVVDVVGIVGDVVGDSGQLRLDTGKAPQLQILLAGVEPDRLRQRTPQWRTSTVSERAVVLNQAFERLPGQIEAVEFRVAVLERRNDAQRLRIVIEAAVRGETAVERALAGVAERRMAEVVGERQRLGEVLVERERAGECAGDLRHFQRVREAGAVMVAFVEDEHLGLVLEAAEGGGVDDAVAVAAKGIAAACRLRMQPAAAADRVACIGRAGNGAVDRHQAAP
jgi:hypothetical protein